jgi:hypothetical protein
MEAIEVTVFIVIAIVLGSLVIGFITDWDYTKTNDSLKKLMLGEEKPDFDEVDAEGFVSQVIKIWDDCGYGEMNANYTFYVKDTSVPSIDKAFLFDRLKKFNICESLQSFSNSCGVREDVQMQPFTLPHLAIVTCHSSNSTMTIS